MENGTLTPSDVALLAGNGNGNGWNDSSFMWVLALLILAGGGFGNFGFGGGSGFANAIGYENLATSNEVQRGFDAQNSMANEREILAAVTSGTAQGIAATNQTFHDTVSVLSDKYSEITRDIGNLSLAQQQTVANQNQCCCDTKMLISGVASDINAGIAQSRYDGAMNTAAINANTTAQTQRILDAISQNKIEELQGKVNALELQNAMAGVLRYPNSWTYNAGTSPFCGNYGCGCGCGI